MIGGIVPPAQDEHSVSYRIADLRPAGWGREYIYFGVWERGICRKSMNEGDRTKEKKKERRNNNK